MKDQSDIKHVAIQLLMDSAGAMSWLWTGFGADGRELEREALSDLAQHPAVEPDTFITVIVPSDHVSLLQAEVPKASQKEWRLAVPYALEEQVAQDVTSVWVALGDYDEASCLLNVAVVDAQVFQGWLAALAQAGIQADAMLPAALLLPYTENAWTLHVCDSEVELRTASQMAYCVDSNNASLLLAALLRDSTSLPEGIDVLKNADHTINLNSVMDQAPDIKIKRDIDKSAIDYQQLLSPCFNLLQAQYAPRKKSSRIVKYWRWCGAVFGLWLVLLFATELGELIYAKREWHHGQQQVDRLVQDLLPGQRNTTDPRAAVSLRLHRLEQVASKGRFLRQFTPVSEVLNSNHYVLSGLSYHKNQMNLRLKKLSDQKLQTLKSALQHHGFTVQQRKVAHGRVTELIVKGA